ncbi:MAG: class I SAM-dependent methyltransferase [Candidatus Pacebacteria bacterium]|nr:class I SAM-dependent methyltransferase [Candidatus Paceibacterota bacterium]
MNYSLTLQNKIISYYERYYKICGLLDFKERAKNRLNEEERDANQLRDLKNIFNFDFNNKKHLVVGAGTGGLGVVLKREYNGEVFGIEPNEQELEIIKEKCSEMGLDFSNFKKEVAENISFSDNFFDFVFCITVLEHVQNVEQSIKEMVRVLRPGGFLYINTPNSLFPVEKHYKVIFPTFLPKIFGKIYLFFRGKPTAFIGSINFFTERKINKILSKQGDIVWTRIYQSGYMSDKSGLKGFMLRFIIKKLFIYPDQEIVIKKNS